MNKSIFKILSLVVSAALIVFYLFIFYLGLKPNVPDEYYIFLNQDNTLEFWPGSNGLDYKLGIMEFAESDELKRRLSTEWVTSEETPALGLIAKSTDTRLYYDIDCDEACSLKLSVYINDLFSDDNTIRVYVGDELVIDNLNKGENSGIFNYDPSVMGTEVRFEVENVSDINYDTADEGYFYLNSVKIAREE